MLWCVLCACLLALASGDCGHRPTELINAEQTCNEEVTDSIIEKIQHSAKGWFQKAKEQLGIDKDAKPEPRKCEYYKCLFEKLGMLNQLDLPDMSLVQQWVNNNVDVGNRGELNGQLVNCFKLLATSAINVQNSCETASHLMMCFHSSDKSKSCACNYEGCKMVTAKIKQKLFHEFYKLTYNEQSFLLGSCIELIEPKRRRVRTTQSRRQYTIVYSIVVSGSRVQICQKTLCSIFQITKRRIQLLVEKLKTPWTDLQDCRGKHRRKSPIITNDEKDAVKEHNFLPNSHHTHNSSRTECLHPDLTLNKLFKLWSTAT